MNLGHTDFIDPLFTLGKERKEEIIPYHVSTLCVEIDSFVHGDKMSGAKRNVITS